MLGLALTGGAFAALAYIGGPLLIRFVQRMQAHPQWDPLDPYGLPYEVWQFLELTTEAVRTLGFVPAAYLSLPNASREVRTFLVMLTHPFRGDKALVTAMLANRSHAGGKVAQYVEFSTQYEDGRCVDTVNTTALGAFHPVPGQVKTRIPAVQDPRELYRVHQYVMDNCAPGGKKVLFPEGGAVEYMARTWVETFDKQVGFGLLYYDPRAAAYRPTLKGAFLMTWGQLWPITSIRRGLRKRAGQRLLQTMEADIAAGRWSPPDADPVVAPPPPEYIV